MLRKFIALILVFAVYSVQFHTPLFAVGESSSFPLSLPSPSASPHYYQLKNNASPRFASYDRIIDGPCSHYFIEDIPPADFAYASVGVRASSYIYSPIGFIVRGSTESLFAIFQLVQKIQRLNKVAKEFNLKKDTLLFHYLGDEGLTLLEYYLRSEQPIEEMLTGKSVSFVKTKILDQKNRRREGISADLMRDIVDTFIQEFQRKAILKDPSFAQKLRPAVGEEYDDHLDYFLRRMGLVVFSKKTRQLASTYPQIPSQKFIPFLYDHLYKESVLTRDGNLIHKKFFGKRVDNKKILDAIATAEIKSPSLIRSIIHDIGFVSPDDIKEIRGSIEHSWGEISSHLKSSLLAEKFNSRLDVFEKHLHPLEQRYFEEEKTVKETIDLAILKAMVPKNDLRLYQLRHLLKLERATKSDLIAVYKLAFLEQNKKKLGNYNFFDLEEDTQTLAKFLFSEFNNKNIHNENFQVVTLTGEEKTWFALSYTRGIGFITIGSSRLITTFFMLQLEAASLLTGALLFTNIATIVTRILSISLHGIRLYHAINGFLDLRISNHILNLLQDYFDHLNSSELKSDEQKQAFTFVKLHLSGVRYVKSQEKKLLTHQIGMRSTWIALNVISIAVCVITIAVLIGVSMSSILLAQLTLGASLLGVASALPFIYLVVREQNLLKNLDISQKVFALYEEGFKSVMGSSGMTTRQSDLIDIYFKYTRNYMRIGKANYQLQSSLHQFSTLHETERLLDKLASAYHHRNHAYHVFYEFWKEIKKDKTDKTDVNKKSKDKFLEALGLSEKQMYDMKFWEYLGGAYHVTGMDIVAKNLEPQHELDRNYVNDLPPSIPEDIDSYYQDIHLANFFVKAYIIYNSVIHGNRDEYDYVLKKSHLQNGFFQTPLNKKEIEILKSHLIHRHKRITDKWLWDEMRNEQVNLEEIHPDLPIEEASFWNDHILEELESLVEYDTKILNQVSNLYNDQAIAVIPPATPHLDELIALYLPFVKDGKIIKERNSGKRSLKCVLPGCQMKNSI